MYIIVYLHILLAVIRLNSFVNENVKPTSLFFLNDYFIMKSKTKFFKLQASGLYHYKTWGQVTTVPPEVCSKVYVDFEYRKKWDNYCKSKPYG